MRRMLTNKNVVDVVNKAIDDGEIQAGGLPEIQEGDAGKVLTVNAGETGAEWAEAGSVLPEIQEGDAGKLLAVNSGETGAEWVEDNSLKLPGTAPVSQKLVGINTSNEQNSLGIGDGLEIASDNITLKRYALADAGTISFNSTTSCSANTTTRISGTFTGTTGHPIIFGVISYAYPEPVALINAIQQAGLLFMGIATYRTSDTGMNCKLLVYNPTNSDISLTLNGLIVTVSYC